MPVLKFETKLVNGRPNIIFETERQKQASKKRDYKSKIQKYPLRNIGNDDSKETEQDHDIIVNNANVIRQNKPKERIKERSQRYSHSSTPTRNYDDEIFGSSNKRLVGNVSDKTQSKYKKESLFNFLKNENKEIVHQERKPRINEQERRPRKKSLTDDDIDEIMRQVVLENKSTLSDDQLVDLLAKIYIEAKRGSHDSSSDGLGHNVRNRRDRSDEREERNTRNLKEMREAKDDKELRDFREARDRKERHGVVPSLDIDESEKKPLTSGTTVGPGPLTMAQKKQMQWDMERKELAKIVSYNPWGRPGCGAPPKDSFESHVTETRQSRSGDFQSKKESYRREPSARTPEPSGLSQAEIKRRQWLLELNEQVAEKERLKYQKNNQSSNIFDQSDNKSSSNTTGDLSPGHGRGKGLANLNQITTEEMILKRHKQIEQQEAIKRQIEEKELIKRLDREKKALLDQQEELRINKEKQNIDSQYLNETARVKQKEDESGRRFNQLRTQLEEAERAALLDKRLKRLQHLELAGHDTRQLRAGLVSDQMTGRLDASTEFITEDIPFNKIQQTKGMSKHGYDVTPRSRYAITEDHGIQTDVEEDYHRRFNDDSDSHRSHKVYRNRSVETVKDDRKSQRQMTKKEETRDRRSFKVPSATTAKADEKPKSKRPESIGSRKPWGVKKINKKYIPQSKRDPFYSNTKDVRENNKNDRVNRILAQVKANRDRIPDNDVAKGHLSERHKKCDSRIAHENDKENISINQGTYDLKNGDYFHTEEDDDRVQASVRYKDSYRQPVNQRSHHDHKNAPLRNQRTPEYQRNVWEESDHEIVRTTDVLDPSTADQRCLISREDTGRERARNSYFKSQNPGQLGDPLDKQYNTYKSYNTEQEKRDPLSYQQSHPTNRQNTILKQLSEIRADLRMRQKDIETSLSMNDDNF